MKKEFNIEEEVKKRIKIRYDDVIFKRKVDETTLKRLDSEETKDERHWEEIAILPSADFINKLKGFQAKKLKETEKSETYDLKIPKEVDFHLSITSKIKDASIVVADKDGVITTFNPDTVFIENLKLDGCKIVGDEITCEFEKKGKDIESILVERDPDMNFMFIKFKRKI